MTTKRTIPPYPKLAEGQHPSLSPQAAQRRVTSPAKSEYFSVKETAIFLKVSKSFVDKLRGSGGGPEFLRLGRRKILYRRVDVENWARARRFESTSQYSEGK